LPEDKIVNPKLFCQDNEVTSLIADGSGGMWAGTYGGGVSHYDPNPDNWQAFTVASTGGRLKNNDVRALTVDKARDLWVGTFGDCIAENLSCGPGSSFDHLA
jgi:ligand-binding sensor domain-containing protein